MDGEAVRKKPPLLLGTDEIEFLGQALEEHPYPVGSLAEPQECGGSDCDVLIPNVDGYDEHLQVVAFTAGMRFQGMPPDGTTIIWMCVRPDCRERITVPKSVWASHPNDVVTTLEALVAEHIDSVHPVNVAPSGLLLP